MYLEKGIEEPGDDHKPSPFVIQCPFCGGMARDISGIIGFAGGGYYPLPEGASYFANRKDSDCGEVFIQTERGTRTTAIYEDGTVREEDSIWHWCDIDGEWDEERDCMIIPKGWWEDRRFNPDDVYNNVVDEKVLAWRPLPPNYCANSKNIECEIEGEKDGFI